MNKEKIARELVALAKELISGASVRKKITRATVKSALRGIGLDQDQYRLSGRDVTFWP